MPSQTLPATQSSPEFSIPTIDISPYLVSPSSVASQKIIDQVRRACETVGFFQIVGHGIPRESQDEVFAASARIFGLSMKEKMKLAKCHSVRASNRGYEILRSQTLREGTLPDLREVRTQGQPFFVCKPSVFYCYGEMTFKLTQRRDSISAAKSLPQILVSKTTLS